MSYSTTAIAVMATGAVSAEVVVNGGNGAWVPEDIINSYFELDLDGDGTTDYLLREYHKDNRAFIGTDSSGGNSTMHTWSSRLSPYFSIIWRGRASMAGFHIILNSSPFSRSWWPECWIHKAT